MRNHRASKARAVNLIKQARRLGFSREVSTMRPAPGARPYAVTVVLHGVGDYYPLRHQAQIIISFRVRSSLRNSSSVAISVLEQSDSGYRRDSRGFDGALGAIRAVVLSRKMSADRLGARMLVSA